MLSMLPENGRRADNNCPGYKDLVQAGGEKVDMRKCLFSLGEDKDNLLGLVNEGRGVGMGSGYG